MPRGWSVQPFSVCPSTLWECSVFHSPQLSIALALSGEGRAGLGVAATVAQHGVEVEGGEGDVVAAGAAGVVRPAAGDAAGLALIAHRAGHTRQAFA